MSKSSDNRVTLELKVSERLPDQTLDDGIIMSGYLFTDKDGNRYSYPAEVTYMFEHHLWVNSQFAYKVKSFVNEHPDTYMTVTARVSDTNELINPRLKTSMLNV